MLVKGKKPGECQREGREHRAENTPTRGHCSGARLQPAAPESKHKQVFDEGKRPCCWLHKPSAARCVSYKGAQEMSLALTSSAG